MKKEIQSRVERMMDYYNHGIGDRIKKKRLEQNLTQEMVANQICSNTYVSKIENNKVNINDEYIGLIMEKLNLERSDVIVPEQVIIYLNQAMSSFFYNDIEEYKIIYNDLIKYEYNVLVFLIKFGYYILSEDFENARIYNEELKRYINNLEEYGFAVYSIFTGYYYLAIRNYKLARKTIEAIEGKLVNDHYQTGLFNMLGYVTYGNLFKFSKANDYKIIAYDVFRSKNNFKRLAEISMYSNIFITYEGSNTNIENLNNHLTLLSNNNKNMYLFVLSLGNHDKDEIERYIDKSSFYYLLYISLSTLEAYLNKDMEKYKKNKAIIKSIQYNYDKTYDIFHIFKNLEAKNYSMIKDSLIREVLPVADRNQNIYLYLWLAKYVDKLSVITKKYKPSNDFFKKIEKRIIDIQKK